MGHNSTTLPASKPDDLAVNSCAAIHGEAPGTPSQHVQWVADVFSRLFFTYISMPPTDPDFGDDAELRRFAHEVLTPMVERAVG
jgi:TetR/AcrR family transcriptional regulator, repressor for uid operon